MEAVDDSIALCGGEEGGGECTFRSDIAVLPANVNGTAASDEGEVGREWKG